MESGSCFSAGGVVRDSLQWVVGDSLQGEWSRILCEGSGGDSLQGDGQGGEILCRESGEDSLQGEWW